MTLRPNLILLAMMAAGVVATSPVHAAQTPAATADAANTDGSAGAQQTPANTSAANQENANDPVDTAAKEKKKKKGGKKALAKTLDTITVTGFSRSIETSIDYQRFSDKIENVVTAADIGGLPDQSIADALTRLPGVSAQRISGQDSAINMRGLTGNFILTTLDGRVQPSSSGSNYTEFDLYPSELIQRVSVYKSSQANVLEGGVGGTIAMQTANPLLNKKDQQFNVDVRGSYNSRAGEVYGANPRGFRISGAYQGKFLDNTLGIGLGFAEMYQPHVAEQFVNESYSNTPLNVGQGGAPVFVNTGIQVNQDGASERRRGYLATVVWQPNDHFTLSGNGFFSKFNDGSFQRGLMAQLFTNGVAVITDPVVTSRGALVGGTVSSIPGGFFGIPGLQAFSVATTDNNQSNDSSVFSGGVHAQWHDDPWTVDVDLSDGHAVSHTVGSTVTLDAYNGLDTGHPLIADQSISFALDRLRVGDLTVANPGMYTDLGRMALSSYNIDPTTYHDRVKAFRTTVKYDLGGPVFYAIEGGVYARNHQYNADRAVWIYGSGWGQYWLNTPNQPPLTLDSSDAVVRCWQGSTFGKFPCFLAVDGPAVLAAHGITPNPVKDWSQNWTETQSGEVDVKVRDAFLQADIDSYLFGRELTGNVGLRVVHTSQNSPGLQQVGGGAGEPIADGHGVISTDYIRVNPGQSYTDYLPSLNLDLHLGNGNQVRFAAAKVMARPPINLLKSGTASYIYNGQFNLSAGTSPQLDPMYATQYDLAFEHYFADSTGVFAADLFFKHVDSFVQSIDIQNFDFAAAGYNVPINPATGKPYLNGEYQTAYNNTEGGFVRGIELQFQKTRFLPGIWSGLGVSLNYAYTDSATTIPSDLGGFQQNQTLPGLSKNVASAALFYDYGKFSARVQGNYRSAFVSSLQVAFDGQTVYFAPEKVFDIQASYRFTKQLNGMIQVLNVTDQPTRSYFGNPEQTSTIQYFGRTLYAGISLSM